MSETQLAERPQSVKEYLALPAYKARFGEVLGSRAPQFMASLITLTNDPNLARCDPKSVIASAMIAAVLDFPIEKSLGFAHIVPYGGVAQFQMAAKGYVQLALRSGQYQRLNAKAVNAEAFEGFDDVGEPKINWEALDDTKPAVGYVVAWRLLNGFTKVAYWTRSKVENHAAQFSQAFKAKKQSSPWFTSFDKMALKTVVMNELRAWGVLSVQMQTAMKHDMGAQKDVEAEVEYVDSTVTDDTPATEAGATVEPAPKRNPPPERSRKGAAAVVENRGTPEGNKNAAIDIPATALPENTTPTARTVAEAVQQSEDAMKQDAKTAHLPPAGPAVAQPAPRAFLKDAEEITTICEVVEVTPLMMAMRAPGATEAETKPSVKVILKGGYNGEATHHGGGTGAPPEMGWISFWEPGNAVKVKLVGKLQPMPTDPKKVTKYSGKVVVRVMDVQQEGSPVIPVEAVE